MGLFDPEPVARAVPDVTSWERIGVGALVLVVVVVGLNSWILGTHVVFPWR
jgi:hypothetical protein